MRETAKLIIVLLLICAVATALLGYVNSVTAGPIAELKIVEAREARMQVMSQADDISEQIDDTKMGEIINAIGSSPEELNEIYVAKAADGQIIGYTIKVTKNGFGGKIEVLVGINNDGKINEVRILSHSETPGLGANSIKEDFYGRYRDKPATGSLSVIKSGAPTDEQIISITGATITSKAVTDAVNIAISAFAELTKGE